MVNVTQNNFRRYLYCTSCMKNCTSYFVYKIMKNDIAIIDSGISSEVLKNPIRFNMEITNYKSCEKFSYDFGEQSFFHGTNCALIIEKYCPNAKLTGVKILDNEGKGILDKLEPALEWCFQKEIVLINLSLGTTHFRDKDVIRRIINHYVNKGMIIIAATANNGYKTYPASFSNVIGVVSGDVFDINTNLLMYSGIDFIAPSNHEIVVMDNIFMLKDSNSYAAPYVTSKVYDFLADSKKYEVCVLKNKLFKQETKCFKTYYPDWIEKGWILSQDRVSNASYYFMQVTGDNKECMAQADTIVLTSREEYATYGNSGKHIVYLGEESVKCMNPNKFFWCMDLRKEQISKSEKRAKDIDIPCIVCRFAEVQDEILWLNVLKKYFSNDGYNAYSVSLRVESVLYDLEYIPKELCNESNIDTVYDFLYWQTYYEQADIIIWGQGSDRYLEKINDMADIFVDFLYTGKTVQAKIYCDGIMKKNMSIFKENFKIFYDYLLGLLKEENSE